MKVEVLRENLDRGVRVVSRAVAGKPQLPVLSHILIKANKGGLELMATDLEISLVVFVGAKVAREGSILIPAKILLDVVATLPAGVVFLELEGDKLKIKAVGVETEISGIGSVEFPEIPRFTEIDFEINAGVLAPKILQVGIAAAKEGVKLVYEGILWSMNKGKVSLAATDGYRLGVGDFLVGNKNKVSYILPVKSARELVRITEENDKIKVKFDREKQQVCFKVNQIEMVSRLIGGEFPNYDRIIPKDYVVRVVVNRQDLESAVRRASIFAHGGASVVRLGISEEGLKISAASADTGKNVSQIEAEVEGDEMVVSFNSKYLLEYLGCVTEEKIIIESGGEMKPGVFRLKKDSFLHIIMPIRQDG